VVVAASLWSSRASAQACCAGSGALTPGRLTLHDDALVGVSLRVSKVYGTVDPYGHYASSPRGASEYDFGQDLFGSMRFLGHGQAAFLVPFVESRRTPPDTSLSKGSEFGGGIGDVNLNVRWDFLLAGQSKQVPGIGILAGITLPTGTSPESAKKSLASDATGVGAYQGNLGLAFEQTFGPWLVNLTGIAAKRAARNVSDDLHMKLAAQFTMLGAIGYAFENEATAAIAISYAMEGNATVNGKEVPDSGRRLLRLSAAGSYPFTDNLRLQGSIFVDPSFFRIDQNQFPTIGIVLTMIHAWF